MRNCVVQIILHWRGLLGLVRCVVFPVAFGVVEFINLLLWFSIIRILFAQSRFTEYNSVLQDLVSV